MKNNLIKIWSLLLMIVTSVLYINCSDDDLNNNNNATDGAYLVLTPQTSFDASDFAGSSYSFDLRDPVGNVSEYKLSYINTATDPNDTVFIKSITDFSITGFVTGQEILDATGLTTNDFIAGQTLSFVGEVVRNDGVTFSSSNVSDDFNAEPSLNQPFEHSNVLGCPANSFVAADAAGTYNVTQHRFDAFFPGAVSTREVVAGPGPNQLTIVGGAVIQDGADDLIIEIDPATNTVTYAGGANDIHFNTFGPAPYSGVSGSIYACAGIIDITIFTGGFIDNYLTLEK